MFVDCVVIFIGVQQRIDLDVIFYLDFDSFYFKRKRQI